MSSPVGCSVVFDDDFSNAPWLADADPPFDPELDQVLSLPGCLQPATLSDDGRIDALADLARLRAKVDALISKLLAAMAPGPTSSLDKEFVLDEIGCVLHESPTSVRWRVAVARELDSRLAETRSLVETGSIGMRHAEVLAEAVSALPDAVAAEVQQRVLPRAPLQTLPAFRRSVRRAVAAADTREAEVRHESAMDNRRVVAREVGDGMGELWAYLPLPDLAQLMDRVRTVAGKRRADSSDPRLVDQRRADALVELVLGRGADPGGAGMSSAGPAVNVTMSLETLLALDDAPAELEGWGTIPASLARALAWDPTGTLRRLIRDPVSGRLLDYGRSTYRPPAQLAGYVKARDGTCRFPGCTRRARHCDIDHLHSWEEGGATSAANCQCLCPRHHHLKHEAGWTVAGDPEAELLWTSPTGHRYRSPPAGNGEGTQ